MDTERMMMAGDLTCAVLLIKRRGAEHGSSRAKENLRINPRGTS